MLLEKSKVMLEESVMEVEDSDDSSSDCSSMMAFCNVLHSDYSIESFIL